MGTLKDWKEIGDIDVKVRDEEKPYTDPITGKLLSLPKTLQVQAWILWTTHGGYLAVSVPPEKERMALKDIPKPFDFLKKSLGLLNVGSVSNFEDPKFTTCHMYDRYFYLFAL